MDGYWAQRPISRPFLDRADTHKLVVLVRQQIDDACTHKIRYLGETGQ